LLIKYGQYWNASEESAFPARSCACSKSFNKEKYKVPKSERVPVSRASGILK
jgi:hypothetical protein